MRHPFALALMFGLLTTPAFATPAQELAASTGITLELAERDIAAQENMPDVVEKLESTLGDRYAGVWFNNKTGRFVVRMVAGADKTAVKAATGTAPVAFAAAETTWAGLQARQTQLDRTLAAYETHQQAATYLDPKTNAVRVLFATTQSATNKASIKATSEPGVIVTPAKTLTPAAMDAICIFPFCTEGEYAGKYGVVRGGVGIHFGYNAYCSAGFIVKSQEHDFLLTAGHCNWYLGTWGPGLDTYKPYNSEPQPCQMRNMRFNRNETSGDSGLATLDGCVYEKALEVWHTHEPNEKLPVVRKDKTMFNCLPDRPDCNRAIPADQRSYVGLWSCHSGWRTGTNCGEVRQTNLTIGDSYEDGVIVQHHLELICAPLGPGDSGGPAFTRVSDHAVGTGVSILGGEGPCTTYAQELWFVKQQLGVRF